MMKVSRRALVRGPELPDGFANTQRGRGLAPFRSQIADTARAISAVTFGDCQASACSALVCLVAGRGAQAGCLECHQVLASSV